MLYIIIKLSFNVLNIINVYFLATMQAHITNWQIVLKTQENNAKMLLIMLRDLKNINKIKRFSLQYYL